ncbi:MAG: hypothetical protein EFT35_10260 [Methanophagales archaeon ANME-1-THS]|nr:MAG: hypothetical protein EFT35_10260 [Methanophagales archaeon ANME-1-THS]
MLIGAGCVQEEEPGPLSPLIPPIGPSPVVTPTRALENVSTVISSVVDGDTVILQNGEQVRLLGINSPEQGHPYYEEARTRLKELIEGKTVRLERDVEDKDQYGRLLRYIYCDDTMVNVEMVRGGYANVYISPPNTKYSNKFEEAEQEAKNAHRGLWKPSEDVSNCITILQFHWNAAGDDCSNLNDEYITFKNTCTASITMTGWTVKDDANHIYHFPDFRLAGGATVTLYTGSGQDTARALYWKSSGHTCNAVWNNDGDTLYLRDITGNLVMSYRYSGFN